MDTLAARFTKQGEQMQILTQQVAQRAEVLRSGGWEGRGKSAFLAEMDGEVTPALLRLSAALGQAGQVTAQIRLLIVAAEEDAAAPFRGEEVVLAALVGSDDEPLPDRTDFAGIDLAPATVGASPNATEQSLIDQVLSLQFPWWVDIPLGFLAVGDIIDLVREQIVKRFAGKEPDALVTALASLGLIAEVGWLNPVPSVEDMPNAALATLKTIAKQLPAGAERDALAALVEKAIRTPDDLRRLADVAEALGKHAEVGQTLLDNPRAMLAAFTGGAETVELMAKHGEYAIKAAQLLGEHVPSYLKHYDELAHLPGADNVLRDLAAGNSTTFGAMGELYYFHSIRNEVSAIGLVATDGRKAADGVLQNRTVVDVKNWDFSTWNRLGEGQARARLDGIEQQVALRRKQYPGQPIRYVFTYPESDIPHIVVTHLQRLGVEVTGIAPQ